MRAAAAAVGLALGACGSPSAVAASPAAGAAVDDRLVFSADGSTLSGGGGTGSGGSGTWLHNFSADTVLGAGAEYQQIANAHWTAGTLSASFGLGQSPAKTHAYAEVHEGAGDIGTRAFHYSLVAAGILGIGKSMGRTTWLLVGDHQNVAGTSRTTISLTCALSLRAQGQVH